MKALKTALDKLAEEGAGIAEKMGHGLLDAFLATDLLGRYHVRLEAVDAGWQAPPEPLGFSEIATEAMTPEAAIEFFRTKTTMIKVPDFVQLAEKYRQRAFTIAWVEEIELLEASKGLLESFLADDRGLEAFRTELGSMFDRAGVTRLADWHLETVYRTNMQTAYNAGRWDELMDPEMIEFFPLIEYHAVLDDRTRPTHRAMHGTRLPRDDPWWEINWPPNGYSCFLPGTLVSGRFVAGLKSRYSGPAREIVTRQGNRLRVTPNHPVMTAQGLIPACELRKGDCLLSYHPHVESESSILGDIDHQDGPMLIEDVFKSLAMNRAVALRVATDLDLHGDAIWTDRNVYVVGTNRVLTTGIESGASENVNNFRFVPSSTGESGIHSFGHLNFFLEGSLSSYGSFPRRSALAGDNLTVIRRPFADIPLDPLCISPAANWHIMLSENAKECPSGDSQVFREFFEALPALVSANDLTDVRELYFVCSDMDTPFPQETIERVGAYAQFISDLFEASAGEITLDDIISIREFYFSGHVYDLQSEYGWILAQNIFTSNCRCTPIPVSELDDLEAKPPPTTTTDDQGRSVPVTADPGFHHNPGTRAGWENTEREIAAKAMDNGIVVRKLPDGSYGPEHVLPGMRSERVRRLATPEDWVDELPPTGMIPPEITPVKPARPRIPKVAPSPQLPPAGMIPDDILPEKIIRLKKEPPISTETAPQLRFQDMDRIGPRAGSNPGGLFQDPTTGEKWYIKTPQTEEMARNEVLASKLYEVAGVEAPQLQLLDVEGRMGVASRWIEDLQQGLGKLQDPAISGIGDGFAVDAWLANWDVAGLEFDNLLVSGSRAVRVDVGGALRFRAQGSLKGSAWGKEVKELETLLDASVNPQSAQVFSGMTREELLRGMKKVIAVPDKTIRNLVDEFGPLPDAERKKLKSIIIARKKFIEARAGELRPGAPAIVQVPANAAKLTAEELSLAKTARQNGHALRFDAGDVEDQSLLVWQETGREGQDIFLARLKLRPEALDRVSRETGALAAEGFKPAPIATKLREIRAGFGKQAGGAGWQAPEGQFFRHASENLEMTLTRREDTFMTSWWGVVDIEASTAARLEDGLDTLRRLGVDVSRPGDLAIEELHLRQIITHMGKDPGEIGPAKSIGARVKRLRKTASRLAGVDDITALPDYSPQGIDQAFGNGPKLRMRPDMVGPKWDTFFREHRLTHAFSTGQSTANIMDAILNSGGNLASTMERLRMGVKWADTMSPLKDMQTGGASYTFTRVKKFSSAHNHPGLVFRSEMLKRLDSISYNKDLYGDVSSPKFIARNRIKDIAGTGESHSFSHSNETIFKNTVSVFDSLDRIVVSTVEERLDVIAVLKKHGISEWPDGRSLDDVVKVVGSP